MLFSSYSSSLVSFVVLSVVIFFPSLVSAAPAITSVSGAFTHGSTVTISGSGFGTKSTAAPVVWDDASTGTYPTDNGKWDGAWPNCSANHQYDPRYYTPQELGRAVSLPHVNTTRYIAGAHWPSSDAYCGYNVMLFKQVSRSWPFYVYSSWYYRVDPQYSSTNPNHKMWDYSKGAEPYDLPYNWYIEYNPGLSNASSDVSWHLLDDDGVLGGGHSRWWGGGGTNPVTNWIKVEVEVKLTNQTDGYVRVTEDGIEKILLADVTTDGTNFGANSAPRTIAVGGYAGSGGPNNWRYFADVYLDYSLSRVILGNAATYAASTIREVQIPSAWSNTSLTLTTNLGQFTSGTAYIYVVDSSGAVNANGYPITIGGISDTTPPAAPTGLVVN